MELRWPRRAQTAANEPKGLVAQLVELVVIVAVALGLALLIQAFLVKPYRIPSISMEPTLKIGQRVLVNRFGNNFGNPHVGEVLVFHPPAGAEENNASCGRQVSGTQACPMSVSKEDHSTNFVKRVVGVPGDRLVIRAGHVYRNGVREKDTYVRPCDGGGEGCDFPTPITVPPGHYFMMGDNRGESYDSRFWGSIPRSWIIGHAFFTYWPPSRIGFL